jgi:hypothetical protein
VSEWISVEDRLPDEGSLVVAAHIYEYYSQPDVACCNHYNGNFFLADDGLDASSYDGGAVIKIDFLITHWMLLPEPPKNKGGVS